MTAKQVYALCKAYTDTSIEGAGAIKGKNCEIQSITSITGGHRITFAWYNGSDVLQTDTLDVMDGADGDKGDKGYKGDKGDTGATGNGIASIEKTSTVGNVDTYTITMTNGTTATFTVTNGGVNVVANPSGTATETLNKVEIADTIYSIPNGGGGVTSYSELEDKPTLNSVTIVGDMSSSDLGLADASTVNGILDGSTIDSFADVESALSNKVDTVQGKGLSTNDFTDSYKNTIDGLGTASAKDVPVSGNASTTEVVMGDDTRLTDSRNAKDVYSWAKAENKPSYTASEVGAIPSTEKGANSGVATLDASGKVPATQLPSYVDDVIEGYYKVADGKFYEEDTYTTEITPESGKIYSDLSTNKTYRWGGSAYVQLDAGLALGETAGTAYEGSKGKANADAITAIKDGSTIDSFGDVETALADKISKSSTAGLVKNDGTIDTTIGINVSTLNTNVATLQSYMPSGVSAQNTLITEGTVNNRLATKVDASNLCFAQFSTSTSYYVGEYVRYNGTIYKCITDHPAGEWNSNHFDMAQTYRVMNEKNNTAPEFNVGLTLAVGDYCFRRNKLYRCTASHFGQWDDSHFTEVKLGDEVKGKANTSSVTAIENKIPSGASSSNKLATASDVNARMTWTANGVLGAKNLLTPIFTNESAGTISNVGITKNGDGTYTYNGIANANGDIAIKGRTPTSYGQYLPIGKYKFSAGSDKIKVYVGTTYNNAYKAITAGSEINECEFEITANTQSDYKLSDGSVLCAFYVWFASGTVFDNDKIKPMVRLATDTDTTYQPYAMTNRELTESVVPVDITSDFATLEEGISYGADSRITKIGKLIIGNIVIKKTGNFAQSQAIQIMTVKSGYRPRTNINNVCHFTSSEWDGGQPIGGYLWIGTNGAVNIRQYDATSQVACKASFVYEIA